MNNHISKKNCNFTKQKNGQQLKLESRSLNEGESRYILKSFLKYYFIKYKRVTIFKCEILFSFVF